MANVTAAKEWLSFALKDLEEAILLDQHDFYTDKIGFSLQQACEKSLKAVLAYNNQKITKVHDLVELLAQADNVLSFDEYVETMTKLNGFYIASRYPMPIIYSPSKEQIRIHIVKTQELYETIKNLCS
ncbi:MULTISPECIES: HEPN domain-containing protein [unclassified Sulfuricurvum]|uniref:HEPN domain-containing protein n=1 Tax=unclassified Sulfuricurvum TaxID=2632390 RepID=UPI000AE0A902|nr:MULTISPECIES: HEPN domain-containing protein [unclassified Sulfuricurvum]